MAMVCERHKKGWRALGALAIAGLALLALSACGRRGPLEPPPDPTVVQAPAAPNPEDPIKRPKVVPITPPTRALPIDSLL